MKNLFTERRFVLLGAILFLSAACQPKVSQEKKMTPQKQEKGSSCGEEEERTCLLEQDFAAEENQMEAIDLSESADVATPETSPSIEVTEAEGIKDSSVANFEQSPQEIVETPEVLSEAEVVITAEL